MITTTSIKVIKNNSFFVGRWGAKATQIVKTKSEISFKLFIQLKRNESFEVYNISIQTFLRKETRTFLIWNGIMTVVSRIRAY